VGGTYKKPHRTRLPKRSRTRPIYGKGDDADRYFKCWNCGFVCDSHRDELGDSESRAGDDHTDYHNLVENESQLRPNPGNKACLGGDIGHYHVAMLLGPDENPKTVYHELTSDISRGCPFCGSTNWRGDY